MSIFIIFLFLSKIHSYYVRLNDRFRHSPNPGNPQISVVIPANFPVIPAQAGISANTAEIDQTPIYIGVTVKTGVMAQAGISLIHSEAVEIPFYNGMTALFFSSYYFPVIPAQAGISTDTAETVQTPICIGVTAKTGCDSQPV